MILESISFLKKRGCTTYVYVHIEAIPCISERFMSKLYVHSG